MNRAALVDELTLGFGGGGGGSGGAARLCTYDRLIKHVWHRFTSGPNNTG